MLRMAQNKIKFTSSYENKQKEVNSHFALKLN